jgi:small-conductance mechanosensitive channel
MAIGSSLINDLASPGTIPGAFIYGLVTLFAAVVITRTLRMAALRLLERDRRGMLDRTVALFLIQFVQISIYLMALIFYAQLIPGLRSIGTALLAGVSVASIVIGLAAQNTLGNLVSGISLLLYRPFQVGDQLQINAPTGLETGHVESITLGYTILKTLDLRRIVVPNNAMISQVTIRLNSQKAKVQGM